MIVAIKEQTALNIVGRYGFIKYKYPATTLAIASTIKYKDEPLPSTFENSESLPHFFNDEYKNGDSDVPFNAKPKAQNTSPNIIIEKVGAVI